MQSYTDAAISQTLALLAIDSPTGYTANAAAYTAAEYEKLGFRPQRTVKGGVLVCLNPEAPEENARRRFSAGKRRYSSFRSG